MRRDRPSEAPSSPAPERREYARGPLAWMIFWILLALAGGGYFLLQSEAEPPAPPTVVTVAPAPVSTPAPVEEEAPVKRDKKEKKEQKEKSDRQLIDDFFAAQGPLPTFKIDLIPEEWEYLKRDPRRLAEATMTVDDFAKEWKGVAVKCKGSAGSFQTPDQRPGLSISMNRYKGADRWNGFLKWHLNNGAQDNSLLNEQISCEMARAAGVPASRCAHALLKWQGRDLGLYLVKEAFDVDFLSHFFKDPEGDLYDGGFVHDIDVNMEKDQGDPLQRDNVKELIAACQEGTPAKKWERLAKILDVDAFLSFIAIESITCHWDGYNFNRNNYRLYFDKTTGQACFFLHGTDQTFGDSNAAIVRDSGALVGQAVMSNPDWKRGYRERVEKIYNEVLKPIDWPARVTEVGEKVRADLEKVNPQWAKDYAGRIPEARNRVANRIAAIAKQLGDLPKPLPFGKDGVLAIGRDGWNQQGAAAALDDAARDGMPCLHIRADGTTAASWRKAVSLPQGKYRFEARAATTAVEPTQGGTGEGAGVRISGGTRTKPNAAVGDTGWQDFVYEFDANGGDVMLVAELRATKGEVWFDRDSFRLRQVK